jgi:hypothetical protein
VSQISPPIRILLAFAVAFVGLYMLFLRPKEEVIPPANEPVAAQGAVSAPGKAAEAAQGAVDASDAQLAQQESIDGVDAGETAAGTAVGSTAGTASAGGAPPMAAADLRGVPKPVRQALRKDKVLVLLFWNGKSVDDKAVREALHDVNRWDGRVAVEVASIKKISKYGRIARGVDVEQSPTIVVADRNGRADTLVGYVDTTTIDQAVVDALRNSSGLFTSSYLKAVDRVCRQNGRARATIPNFYGSTPRNADARLASVDRSFARLIADFKAVKAPKRWRAFKSASLADLTAVGAQLSTYSATVSPTTSISSIVAADQRYSRAVRATSRRATKRFDGQNLTRCGSQF